ncbi:type IV pilin [Halobacteriales archaeon QH_2_65_14]|nr:MAG: type IV pilin [Halobacteriales archaeon QH_2_65_14]
MRAQSHVVGFALIVGLGVLALGTLTLSVGTVMDSQTSTADATRVAEDMSETLQVVERTGIHSNRVTFAEGRLSTAERTLRVLDNGTVVHEIDVGALVFERDEVRVAGVVGAVVRGGAGHAWLPPITSSERNEVLVVGAPVLNASHVSISGRGGVTTTLQTDVSHTRTKLGNGSYAVTIETETPGPFERYFEQRNATTTRRSFPGDEYDSVVVHFPGERVGYLVVHDVDLEVRDG